VKCYWLTIYIKTTTEFSDDEANMFNHEISQEESNMELLKHGNIWIKRGKLSY
jgi:hypothetical protein